MFETKSISKIYQKRTQLHHFKNFSWGSMPLNLAMQHASFQIKKKYILSPRKILATPL